ncbi:MAG TPA: diguanylate cyclase [Pirellulales bacterium]
MSPDFSSIGVLLTINLLFASFALAIGFAAGVWFFGGNKSQSEPDDKSERESHDHRQQATDRAMMASHRIQDLAKGVLSDVGVHTSNVEAITDDLRAIVQETNTGPDVAVFMTIGRIVEANNQIKERLASAEKQIEAQASELRDFESEARTDSLTGLANRRAFDDELKRRYAEWQRRKSPFTLLMLDIDHFKQFNDSHGHQAGDEVLRNAGKVLVKISRQMDLPCRYGGEEFAVVLPATDIHEARIAAERFRKAIEATAVKFEGKKLTVTASIGVAQIGEHDDPARLLRRADDALYKSKEAGRNCGHWHDGKMCLPIGADAAPSNAELAPKSEAAGGNGLVDRLPSKEVFVDTLQRRVTESQRFGIPLTVMHLRIDDYATIKRTYGKSIAQLMLDSVAQFTGSVLREMDLLARLDEGEFGVMLPGSTEAEAALVAQRLHAAMAQSTLPIRDSQVQLRACPGIAQLQTKESADQLMARAARAGSSVVASQPATV